MKKRWLWLGLVVFLIVVVVVSGVYFFRLRQIGKSKTVRDNNNSTQIKVSALPDERTTEFNPTINTPVFAVMAVGGGQKSLKLK